MNKRIIVILVAILVVLLAAIAVIEIVGPKGNDKNQGYDDVEVETSDIDEVYDLETGEVIGSGNSNASSDSSNDTDGSDSSTQTTDGNKVTANETVTEAGVSNSNTNGSSEDSSSVVSNSSSSTTSNSSESSESSNVDSGKKPTANPDIYNDGMIDSEGKFKPWH